jgi:metal-sulfur cluster biosynthetic enzyme
LILVKRTLIEVNTASAIRAKVPDMGQALSTVWLQPEQSQGGCAACLPSTSGPQCRAHVSGEPCAHPRLAGRHELLQRVMQELNREVIDPDAGLGIVDLHWVQALRIEDGEAELTLGFALGCGPAKRMSESAFQTLRRLLPDTDVYVRHAH